MRSSFFLLRLSQSGGPRRGCGGLRPIRGEAPSAGNFPLRATWRTERRYVASLRGTTLPRSIHSPRLRPLLIDKTLKKRRCRVVTYLKESMQRRNPWREIRRGK